eukprot:CAMPEP_0118962446 /NCGR_PEP_ID=MMETSP1173-20130426/788_1 /TAXON_ID=1034831 /ORGANISM="Rhizochromulina marina cf, Strain CCMP1243" /LENGTH=221 /DNA_ID=CAMNT_0006910713 /DNA_START=107 /DNA_END=772 /DNA_ORIENTATION=+
MRAALRVLTVALLSLRADAFFAAQRPGAAARAQRLVTKDALMSADLGLHGTGSRFIPLVQLGADEVAPRTVPVAGMYPGITVSELMAPESSPAPNLGTWHFDFTDPEGPQLGTVALPAANSVHLAEDPVVLVSKSEVLGLNLSNDVLAEVLVVVDRARTKFQRDRFFAFAAPDGSVEIGWRDELPEGMVVAGRVELVYSPHLPGMESRASGFLEEEDDFNF